MEIEFQDKRLALIETDRATELKFALSIINSCQRKLEIIRAAPDEQTLRNWKSLHYKKLEGKRKNERSIRLNDQWRLIFLIDLNCNPPKINILEIADYH